jgi:hypothetical protein
MTERRAAILIALLVLLTRLCHRDLLWIEEAYPMAAAAEVLRGKVLYRDIWFDKPPFYALFYAILGASAGWPLRLAGAGYVLFTCLTAWYFLRQFVGKQVGIVSAGLLAIYLTFDIPSAIMALAPDLLAIPFHIAAVGFAMQRRPFLAGFTAGVALLFNTKALFVLAACLLWSANVRIMAGFLLPTAVAVGVLAWTGSLEHYWEQVWVWGARYSGDTFVVNPWREGLVRTLNWAGFHAAIVLGTVVWLWKRFSWRVAAWIVLSLFAVCAGWRFFPRYYFHLLPVFTFAGVQGLWLLKPRWRVLILATLLIPTIRFGPRYAMLATGAWNWSDLALMNDSRDAAAVAKSIARSGDHLFVWGYRPDMYVFSGLPAGTRFLDSQPLSGVMADRHLTTSKPTALDIALRNQQELLKHRPEIIVDGLGGLNPALAVTRYPFLRIEDYAVAGRTRLSTIYVAKR